MPYCSHYLHTSVTDLVTDYQNLGYLTTDISRYRPWSWPLMTDTRNFPYDHGEMDVMNIENLDIGHGHGQISDQLTTRTTV